MTTAFGTVWRFSVSTRPDQRGIGSHRSVVVVAADLPTRPLARSLIIRLPVRSSLRSAIEVTQARTKASKRLVGPSVRPLSMSPRRPSSRVTAFTNHDPLCRDIQQNQCRSRRSSSSFLPPGPVVHRVRPSIAMIRHHFPPVFSRRRCRRHVFARLIWPSLPPILPPFFPSTPSVASYGRNVATAVAVDLSVGREQPMPQFVEARAGAGTVSRQVTASAATRPARRPILHVEKSRKCRRGGGAGRRKRRNKGVGRAPASY